MPTLVHYVRQRRRARENRRAELRPPVLEKGDRRGGQLQALRLISGRTARNKVAVAERRPNASASYKLLALALVIASGALVSPWSAHAAGLETSSRIMASPRVTEGQVVRYLVPKYNGRYTDADVRWIVDRYFQVAPKVGVDPLVVMAQMDHETAHLSSYWSQRPRRNPAGIGVTGAPGAGVSFPRWSDSVDAHVGRLLAYALPKGAGSAEQKRLIARALSWRPLPDSYRGSARTIYGLQGRWATDRYYAGKLARVGDAIDATR